MPPTQPRIEAGNLSTKLQLNSAGITVASETNTINPDIYTNGVGTYYKIINNNTLFQSAPTAFAVTYSIRNKPYRLSSMVSVLDGVSTTTNYAYDAGTLPKRTETVTNSNGVATTSTYFYASDPTSLVNNASNSDLSSRNMIGFPIKVRQVTGTSTKWSKVDYFLFNTNQIEPQYLRECFEATPVNWIDRLKITGYTTNGMPSMIFKNNFTVPESYTWDAIYPKLLRIKTFGNVADKILTWKIDYNIVGTVGNSLVEKMTDENGLIKKYTYDRLMRLQMVQDRMDAAGANTQATTTYTYQYKDATNPLNYIGTSTTFVNATNTTPLSTKQYMDGLGRPVSTVRESYIPNTTNQQKNNITYDALGRQYRAFLPFASTTLGYEAAATSPVTYTQTEYELSPLSRPIKQTNVDATIVQTSYGSNLASEVRLFTIPSIGTVSSTAYYVANLLYKVTMTDENNNQTVIFKDKLGRVILTRKFLSGANIDTYNVYDDFNQLVAVLPPGSVDATGVVTYSLIFQYYYDFKNRLAQKKVPGADLQTFYYDNRDLMVLTQDGNMRATSSTKYLATLYDELGRVMKTGFATVSPATNMDFTLTDAQITDKLTETIYHTNKTWVKHQGAKVLKPAGVSTNTDFVWSYIERRVGLEYTGNPIWTGKQHLLYPSVAQRPIDDNDVYGVDWSISGYNGMQQADVSIRYLFTGTSASEVRTRQEFTYDNGRRMTNAKYAYALNGQGISSATFNLSNMVYNYKDQLEEKNIGLNGTNALQSIDYTYNLRGWLTAINNVTVYGNNTPIMTPPMSGSGYIQNLAISPFIKQAVQKSLQTSEITPPVMTDNNTDLFNQALTYGSPDSRTGATPQYNGNISSTTWQVLGRDKQAYGFKYDYLDRLTESKYFDITDSYSNNQWNSTYSTDFKFNESSTYDLRGNILSLQRNGLNGGSWTSNGYTAATFGLIDNLTYNYNGQNQVTKVVDASLANKGFIYKNASVSTAFTYDSNGNLTSDANKGITSIEYNYLNLPMKIVFNRTFMTSYSNGSIEFIYDATGAKLRKTVKDVNGNVLDTRDYVNGVEYNNGTLSRIAHTEGSVARNEFGAYEHQYALRDHLGNTRVTFRDGVNKGDAYFDWNTYTYVDPNAGNTTGLNDGTITSADIMQINNYYPFGLNMEGNWNGAQGGNKYQYNGKEWNDDFGLGWNDYGARFYDPAIFRWLSPDPLSEKYLQWSPYNYTKDNPIKFIDPDGRELVDPNGKKVTYKQSKDGSLEWSKNATADIKRIGSAMAKTEIGMKQLKGLADSKTKVSIKVSQEVRRDEKGGLVYGFTQPTLNNKKEMVKADITIYEGSHREALREKNENNEDLGMMNPEDKNSHIIKNNYSRNDDLGAIGVHEATHVLDKGSSRALIPGRTFNQYESKPSQNQYNHYLQLDKTNSPNNHDDENN